MGNKRQSKDTCTPNDQMVCSLGVRHSTWVLEPRAPWDVGGNERLGQKRGALLTRDYSIGAVLQDRQVKGG